MGKKKYIKKTEDNFDKQKIKIVNNLANNVASEIIESALNRVSIAESENVVDACEAVNKMLRGLSFKSKKQEYVSETVKNETVSEVVKKETVIEATESENLVDAREAVNKMLRGLSFKSKKQEYVSETVKSETASEAVSETASETSKSEAVIEATVSEAVSEVTESETSKSETVSETANEGTVSETASEATESEQILTKDKTQDEYLKENEIKDPIESNNFLTQLQDLLLKVRLNTAPQPKKYALYFIALEDDNMFLHLSYKKSEEQILYQCEQLYEYTKLFKPLRVVYTMDDCDLTDADKYVKQFMKMFGEDSIRGGSYTDIILPEWQKNTLDLEFETASIEKLDEIESTALSRGNPE
jgi:hypothetical protein